MKEKIIRSICQFSANPTHEDLKQLEIIKKRLEANNFSVQTQRLCSPNFDLFEMAKQHPDYFYGLGALTFDVIEQQFNALIGDENISFHLDLTQSDINISHVELLFEIIARNASKTFNFSYVFNNPNSSPYFPSSQYYKNGFSLGLQSTDLAHDCRTVQQWLLKQKTIWNELHNIFKDDLAYLGLDSSIAPVGNNHSSLIYFLDRIGLNFNASILSNTYMQLTQFIKQENPKPIGLCGLMLPCVEDFKLAEYYQQGEFTIERNLFLSLHSGLGIDTFPIGIDQDKNVILTILQCVQGLSNKYKKPMSIRFICDGVTKINGKTNFQNKYLQDVTVRALTD